MACSVANRSGVGEDAARGKLQAESRRRNPVRRASRRIVIIKMPRPVYKPHSVRAQGFPASGQSSILAARCRAAHAAYPKLMETSSLQPPEGGLASAWPCSRRGLPGRLHYCKRRWSLTPPFHHHLREEAVCFCGPDPASYLAPDVIRRRALWSADFPRFHAGTAIARPT